MEKELGSQWEKWSSIAHRAVIGTPASSILVPKVRGK
jgi:hypothetical protein